ncbi:MAG: AAA family ATPase [bacterium]|nr:AAA family ATPase [bacterium]
MPKRIVLTGGPCAGKTTARAFLSRKLADMDWKPILVPEVATFIIGAGLKPWELENHKMPRFQELLLNTQLIFENSIFKDVTDIWNNDKRTVVVCDRGCMDGKAYMDNENFVAMLRHMKLDEVALRDRRYDGIFHLITAADGAEKFYNLDNPARTDTPEQARELDKKTQAAWTGAPHLVVIDNSTDFDKKLHRLLNAVRRTLGVPVALEIERKFLIHDQIEPNAIPVPFVRIQIQQIYLRSEGGQTVRLRRRSQEGSGAVYYRTIKLPPVPGSIARPEIEQQITADEFYSDLANRDPESDAITKERVCFLWRNQYFELDIFLEPERLVGTTLLEVELTEENDRVEIPDWLGKVIEVTDQPEYGNQNLAKRPQ